LISYSQNFEDVILQRVFADVSGGFYIDVGASYPVRDSNTFALYEKGWRGVAVEPLPYEAAWQAARPRDILLNVAVGADTGFATLHVYDEGQQVSSASPETRAHWERVGLLPTRAEQTPVLTLNHIIEDYASGKTLHLLCIDVEGMEEQVLAGLDLTVHRPWVVVVEAVLPGTPQPSHHVWEPRLINADYAMTYFDGVNRFYTAREQNHLLPRFALPPNVWDRFETLKQLELQHQVETLTAQLKALKGG
jgi:FkbM family methyltransferase